MRTLSAIPMTPRQDKPETGGQRTLLPTIAAANAMVQRMAARGSVHTESGLARSPGQPSPDFFPQDTGKNWVQLGPRS